MVQFVVQKKFTKNTTTISSSKIIGKKTTSLIRRIPSVFFWIFFLIIIGIYWIFLLLKYTIFDSEYRITKVDYTVSSIEIYDDPYVYKEISNNIKGENYYLLSWNRTKIASKIKQKYPLVSDILIKYTKPNTLLVKVLFDTPQLLVLHNSKKFWVYKDSLFEILSWNLLWSSWVVRLEILSFDSWWALTGLFFRESVDDLLQDIYLIKEWFPEISRLSYIPWWHRMIVHVWENKKIYINNAIDIVWQIENYKLLKKYYSDFKLLKEIDLWSLESDKVIVSR